MNLNQLAARLERKPKHAAPAPMPTVADAREANAVAMQAARDALAQGADELKAREVFDAAYADAVRAA